MRISDWSSDVCSSDLIFDVEEFARCIMPQPLRRDPLPVDQYVEGARPLIAPIGRLKNQRPRLHLHAEFKEAARPGVASLAAAIGHGVAAVASSEEHKSELQQLLRIAYAVV